ncbi:EscU/YscU/HrcU family type III secretion system export apparatus switch protein [Geosporobacter ferrireducens]|uniref:EscU/YscU/HrcU family type III secretion system export apparatus switch protein n=1 Tax=Geosporobacter ferrireducens TaxID=1424294 RepID=UPI00139DD650|nr:EscU/YscU/HrcU family type III secretion system export apparatus switch protein [Geosporobacter ferrireducens]MTI53825.1 EscU/YscU/HrcU family type III secretion system export apparatus switch protein [Geosporobacter ferrireducens]
MKDMKEKSEIVAAIQYNEEKDHAPKVVAKGKGEIAQKIKSIAEVHEIPTYQDEKLARQLYNLSIGEEIPPELYHVVAEILAFIITLDTKE